jgi:chemotaxis protein MotB
VKIRLEAKLIRANFTDRVRLVEERRGLVVSLTEAGFFDPGSARLKESSETVLRAIAETLLEVHFALRIEGHTDNVPIHNAQFPSNWELSTARATHILSYLVANFSFKPEQLSVAGYGQYRPIATNTTAEGRAMNRRVDVVILSESEQQLEPQ